MEVQIVMKKEDYERVKSYLIGLEQSVKMLEGFVRNRLDDPFSRIDAQKFIFEYELEKTHKWLDGLHEGIEELYEALGKYAKYKKWRSNFIKEHGKTPERYAQEKFDERMNRALLGALARDIIGRKYW